jgi:branched-chain amino acid transport system substrate-binding protein
MIRLQLPEAGRTGISRNFTGWVGLTALMSFLTVCAAVPFATAADEPIKIGIIAPISGDRAQIGGDIEAGFKIYMDEVKGTIAGRKIQLIVEDEGTPTTATTKTRKLITHDKVDVLAGLFNSSSAYAVAPLAKEANVPLIITASAGDDSTQRKATPNQLRVNACGSQAGHTSGQYAYEQLKWRRVAIIGWEHAFGQETLSAFQKVFEDAGGKVVQRIYTPRNTMDFSPYVANLKRDVDGIFAVVTGPPNIRFLSALRARGLMNTLKVLTVLSATDESFLQELGPVGDGVLSVNSYSVALNTPENAAFIATAKKHTNREISGVMMDAFVGAKLIAKGIEAVKGDVKDKNKFIQALRAVEITDAPQGKIKMDAYGQATQSMFVRKVENVKGRWQNTVIFTYPMVSQFGKYDPAAYLKAPIYSPDYPKCTYCE